MEVLRAAAPRAVATREILPLAQKLHPEVAQPISSGSLSVLSVGLSKQTQIVSPERAMWWAAGAGEAGSSAAIAAGAAAGRAGQTVSSAPAVTAAPGAEAPRGKEGPRAVARVAAVRAS